MDKIDFNKLAFGHTAPKPGDMERMRAETINKEVGHLNEEDGYDCPLCRNKGYYMVVEEANNNFYMISKPCKCDPVRRNIRRMKQSGLEKLIQKCRFENYETPEPWQEKLKKGAMEYAKNPDGWFYIGGNSGAGKTHLCTAICRQLLLDGHDVLYMLWRDKAAELKGYMNTDDYSRLMDKYKTVEVLYIDDLFKTGKMYGETVQKPTPADQQIAFELLNFRINNKKTTIISSECTVSELIDIDEATGGRIVEGNHVFSIGHDRKKNWRLRNIEEL